MHWFIYNLLFYLLNIARYITRTRTRTRTRIRTRTRTRTSTGTRVSIYVYYNCRLHVTLT